MQKHFYSSLVSLDDVLQKLHQLHLSDGEYIHLTTVLHSSIHTVVLDVVLSELSEDDKKQFLQHMHENNHESIWTFLHAKIIGIEEKIVKATQELRKEFLRDIAEKS